VNLAGFIATQRAEHQVPYAVSCRALGVSQSWFYKWQHGDMSLRRATRASLAAEIRRLFVKHKGRYGSPRVAAELRKQGRSVSVNTVAELMAEQDLVARRRRRRKSTTQPDPSVHRFPADRVRRDFSLRDRPNQVWVGDLTEIPTGEGILYLAAVQDLHSRLVPGFATGDHHDAPLAKAALCMAVAVRGGDVTGVVFHSDRGGEYTGDLFARACTAAGITQSMGRTGSALDNAAAESFNSTIEFELLRETAFATKAEARAAVAGFIEEYNTTRLHSTLDMLSPIDYERAHREPAA
jgi:transposase InsO family protein